MRESTHGQRGVAGNRVTNDGNSPLTGVGVLDLRSVGVTCPKTHAGGR